MPVWIDDHTPLPPGRLAMGADEEAPGLAAIGGRVTPGRLEEAYRIGLFPWFSHGQPVLWWSPDPRMVLPVAGFRLSHSLRKTLRRFVRTPGCALRIDAAFEAVMRHCAQTPRAGQDGTWIQPEMIAAYTAWHQRGRVHSFETWVDGRLVGGLYGVAIGRMFFGESMFAHQTDASKIALAGLVAFCRAHDVRLIDCQQNTGHLASLGGREITRAEFEARLQEGTSRADIVDWTYDVSMWTQLALDGAPSATTNAAGAAAPAATTAREDPP